jgi:hypothetical protein
MMGIIVFINAALTDGLVDAASGSADRDMDPKGRRRRRRQRKG